MLERTSLPHSHFREPEWLSPDCNHQGCFRSCRQRRHRGVPVKDQRVSLPFSPYLWRYSTCSVKKL